MIPLPQQCLYDLLRIALRLPRKEQYQERLWALSPTQWQCLVKLSREHLLSALVYDALVQLGDAVELPEEGSIQLMLDADRISRKARRVYELSEQLHFDLLENGFHPQILKGSSVASMYPQAELRAAGDIDLYLPSYEQSLVCLFLTRHYGKGSTAPDGSYHFKDGDIDIDLHTRFYDLSLDSSQLPAVNSPEAQLILLSSHILKHALGAGVGLRQLCDLAMANRQLSSQYDAARLEAYYHSTGTYRWNRMLHSFLRERLGEDSGVSATLPPARFTSLERIVFEGGNFGHYAPSRKAQLRKSPAARKADTLFRHIRRLPFALYYAPREYSAYLWQLFKGNISR